MNRDSAKLQCVVAAATPADLTIPRNVDAAGIVTAFMGMPIFPNAPPGRESYPKYKEASPVYHIAADSAPTMLFHGDADPLVPIEHADLKDQALRKAGVAVKLARIPGGTHMRLILPGGPDFLSEAVRWFAPYLRSAPQSD